MERPSIYFTDTIVKTYETDFQGHWKPACFVMAMIEAATRHAAALGFDFSSLTANDMVWVLSRFKVRFMRYPANGERIAIKTWPKGLQQKLFFMRDFELTDETGAPVAVASFAWLLMDPKARRLLFPQSLTKVFGLSVPDNGGLSALDEPLERIEPPAGLPERLTAAASYSAVDMLGHANAARYVEWISNCFSLDEHRSRQPAWLQVNYNHEIRPGEQLSIRAGQNGDENGAWYFQGSNLNTGEIAFEAALAWS